MSETILEHKRKVQCARIISEKVELFDTAIFALSEIITSLPENKDWLCPATERIARQVIKEGRKLKS